MAATALRSWAMDRGRRRRRRRGLIARTRAALPLLALALVVGAPALAAAAPAAAASNRAPRLADPARTGRALATEFLTVLQQGDAKGLAAILAPNFQVARADGTHADRSQYLANPAKVSSFVISDDLTARQDGRTLSVRWGVLISEQINGETFTNVEAPRLTSFVWRQGRWQMVSHANFNPPR